MKSRTPQRGRPPAIDRKHIEQAVKKIRRRENVTVRRVAEALDVYVTTIYRHVGGVTELRQIHVMHDRRSKGSLP